MSSFEDLSSRHKKERRELDGKIRALLKTAKKSSKKDIDAEVARLEAEMGALHTAELDALKSSTGAADTSASCESNEAASSNDNDKGDAGAPEGPTEDEKTAAKIAKARRKKEKKGQKELEHQLELEAQRANRGPTLREIELDALNRTLLLEGRAVKEMAADGSCLYHAVSDQLRQLGVQYTTAQVRRVAADSLRDRRDDFAPFLGFDAHGPEYESYCSRVESSTMNEWGGETEIKALANGLGRTIVVYSAGAPPLVMRSDDDQGDGDDGEQLRLVFHRHFLTSGEHYNSVQIIH